MGFVHSLFAVCVVLLSTSVPAFAQTKTQTDGCSGYCLSYYGQQLNDNPSTVNQWLYLSVIITSYSYSVAPTQAFNVYLTNQLASGIAGVGDVALPSMTITFTPNLGASNFPVSYSTNQGFSSEVDISVIEQGLNIFGGGFFVAVNEVNIASSSISYSLQFTSDYPDLSITWQFSAALYQSTALSNPGGVPTEEDLNQLQLSSVETTNFAAGTPIDVNVQASLVPGGTGTGGNDYTGILGAQNNGYQCVQSCPSSTPTVLTGDPHYKGADGSNFDFTGVPGDTYCLVSDAHLHINAFYDGRYDTWEGRIKPLTWVRQLAIMWGHHSIVLSARTGADAAYGSGYVSSIEVDGKPLHLSQAGDSVALFKRKGSLTWAASKAPFGNDLMDVYTVAIKNVVNLTLEVLPEIDLLRTPQDAVVHFNLEVNGMSLTQSAHGVLGQTYRRDRQHKLAEQKLVFSEQLQKLVVPGDNAESYLDGTVESYKTSGVLKTDCPVSRFVRASRPDHESARAIETAINGVLQAPRSIFRKFLRR